MKIFFKRIDDILLIKVESKKGSGFAEYKFHEKLGYKPIEEVINDLLVSEQNCANQHFLLTNAKNDLDIFQSHLKSDLPSFLNHSLFYNQKKVVFSSTIKYKCSGIQVIDKESINNIFSEFERIRIDVNELYDLEEIKFVLNKVNQDKIDYIEDPITDKPFKNTKYITDQPFYRDDKKNNSQNFIYRPTLKPSIKISNKTIFSNQFSNILGSWQSYCYLLEKGNLDLIHGIYNPYTPELYNLTKTNKLEINKDIISQYYQEIRDIEWILLKS